MRKNMPTRLAGLAGLALVAAACGSSTTTASSVAADASKVDTATDSSTPDSTTSDSFAPDTAPSDTGSDTGSDTAPLDTDPSKDFGFAVRLPGQHTLTCSNPSPMSGDTLVVTDADFICAFSYKGATGHVYVQNTATGCEGGGMSNLGTFTSPGSWMSLASGVAAMSGGSYDWGGNHHNDSLEFDYQGKHFRMYHSSFGYGWRKCQPMDCIQVTAGVGGDIVEDGCTKDRTLPIWCSQVELNGSYAPPVDAFKKCAGDPNP